MRKNSDTPAPRRLSIMGSTGSIGTQTLDIVSHYPELFKVEALTAHRNWEMLAAQALQFRPKVAVIADTQYYDALKAALKGTGIEAMAGEEALVAAATLPQPDIVVGALVGYSGLPSTVAALEAGKTVALANKETLVVGGEIIDAIVRRKGKRILPVDSEHSAIFQCLQGENPESVHKIILTASGGPFRRMSKEALCRVTVSQALAHPNWDMGAKVTIDSATMMNKGFEMIEAKWLFNKAPDDIEVLVHPDSIVHSLVEFTDGSVKAQLGLPDMRLPIAVAIAYPSRLDLCDDLPAPHLNLAKTGCLSFEQPDMEKFPLLGLAYDVARRGGLLPALMNAANEVAVRRFLMEEIAFTDIFGVVTQTVEKGALEFTGSEVTLENINMAHTVGTDIAEDLIKTGRHTFKF